MPKIYTHNNKTSTIGIYVSDDKELQFIVEVRRRTGSNLFTYLIDNVDKVRNHFTAEDAFAELACTLGADIERAPQNLIKKEFILYKNTLTSRAEERKLKRENKLKGE